MQGDKGASGSVKSIDTALFDEAISAFERAINCYRESRDKFSDSSSKLDRSWEGMGHDRYSDVLTILKTELKDEEDNLFTIIEDLEDAKLSYQEWDESLASSL